MSASNESEIADIGGDDTEEGSAVAEDASGAPSSHRIRCCDKVMMRLAHALSANMKPFGALAMTKGQSRRTKACADICAILDADPNLESERKGGQFKTATVQGWIDKGLAIAVKGRQTLEQAPNNVADGKPGETSQNNVSEMHMAWRDVLEKYEREHHPITSHSLKGSESRAAKRERTDADCEEVEEVVQAYAQRVSDTDSESQAAAQADGSDDAPALPEGPQHTALGLRQPHESEGVLRHILALMERVVAADGLRAQADLARAEARQAREAAKRARADARRARADEHALIEDIARLQQAAEACTDTELRDRLRGICRLKVDQLQAMA